MIVLALTVALVGPYFIDWTPYRAAFEREAGRVLGRRVTVKGTAYARLLPFPSVTFTDVTVAGDSPDEPAMTVEQFSMDAEMAPFLRGEVLIFDMRLVRPSARIEVSAEGDVDWAVRPSTPFDPRQVTLEKVTITEGSVAVIHQASGRTHRIDEIDAVLSAKTLAGPWRIDGSARLDGVKTALTVSTGTADVEGQMRLRIEALPEGYPLMLSTDGSASLKESAVRYAGSFRLDTLETGTPEADRPPRAAENGNRVNGTFAFTHDRLDVEAFRLESGPVDNPYTADGSAYLELGRAPRFFLAADGAQIRFDGQGEDARNGDGVPLARRFAAFRDLVLNLPKPTIPGTIEVNLPAIVAGDTMIRNIRLSAKPAETGWSVGTIAATLPGRTRFEGEGLLSTGEELGFSGKMLLAVGQPSGFAAWLARDVDDAIRRLPGAGFSADVELTEERQTFSDLELILGEARFTGSAERHQPPGARPSVAVRVDGGRLDLEGLTAFAALFVSEEGENRLVDHDVDFEVGAGPVTAAGLTAETVDTALRLRQGELEIDRLTIGGLAGAQVSATGQIRDFSGAPTGKIDAAIVAVDLEPLATRLGERFPDNRLVNALSRRAGAYPGLLENAEIDLVASAADNGDGTSGMAVSAKGVAGGTRFSFAGSGLLSAADGAPFTVNFSARNDEAAALYALYGLPALPFGLAGGAETELSITGTTAEGANTTLRFAGEGLEAQFDGVTAFDGDTPALRGKVRLDSDDLEPWLAVSGVALPGFGFGLPVDLQASVDFDGDLAVMSEISGQIAGSAVGGDLNGSMKDGRPHIEGSMDFDSFDLAPVAELVLGHSAFDSAGEEQSATWPQVPFSQGVSVPASVDLALTADTLFTGTMATAHDASMQLRLDAEGFAISDLSAALHDGRLSGLAELDNNAGTGLFSAQLRLEDADIAALLPDMGLSGRGDVAVEATASGKTVDGMVAALSGSGSASLRDLSIAGLNPDAFRPIVRRADAIGRDIDAAATARFAPQIVRQGTFEAGDSDLAFTIAGGVLRTPPVQMQGDGVRLAAEARANLSAMSVAAGGSITYDPGLEAVTGSEPTVRFSAARASGAVKTSLDTEPLAQFLTQRALEREQARVEHMQAVLLEKQRLRRETRYYAALQKERERAEAERLRFEREAEHQRREAEERARREAEEEAQRRAAEEEARREAAEAAARRQAMEEAARQQAAENARRRAEEQARRQRESTPRTKDGIERRPLPPPETAPEANATQQDAPNDPVAEYFRSEDLTVDGLLRLIEPSE